MTKPTPFRPMLGKEGFCIRASRASDASIIGKTSTLVRLQFAASLQ
jgi:hypothetical protein